MKLNKELLEKLNILYVEDEKMIQEEVAFFCKRFIPNFHVASNGLEAIEMFHKVNPDVIVTDIQMPKMNGIDMLKKLRPEIPIIITTAFSDIEYFLHAIELKVTKFVIKPIDLKDLLFSIQECIVNESLKDKLFEKENLLKILDENVIISITDKDGVIVNVSQLFCKNVGFSKDELLGKTHQLIKHEENSNEFYRNMWNTITSGKVFKTEIKNRKKNKELFWSNLTITPVLNKEGNIENYMAIREDITSKKKLEQLAIVDETTDLYNRRYFNEVIEKEIRRVSRDTAKLNLAILDVDYFKNYNDTYGHQRGDEALLSVANVLKDKATRASDYAFRLGGEEFGLIYTSNSIKESLEFLERILKELNSLNIKHETSKCGDFLSISAGVVAISSEKILDSKDMYKLADEALYVAKNSGRNQVSLSNFNSKV